MAEEELELAEPSGSNKKLFLLIGIVVLVLLLGGGAAMYFMGVFDGDEGGEEAAPEAVEEVRKEAIYVALEPSFTVNLQSGSKARYLQIAVQVLVREPELEEALKTHSPAVRSQLLLLFSGKTSQDLSSVEGKQALQKETLDSIQKAIKDATGLEGIEAVLFTSFVMQ